MKFGASPAAQASKDLAKKTASQQKKENILVLPLDSLVDNEHNKDMPMDDIESVAESIRANGLIQPINVYDNGDGTYEILSGHRRCSALRLLGRTEARCIVVPVPRNSDGSIDVQTKFRQWADANTQTRDKDIRYWIGLVKSAEETITKGLDPSSPKLKQDEVVGRIGELIGKSKDHVYRILRIEKMQNSPVMSLNREFGLSEMTLVLASSLNDEQANQLVEKVRKLYADDPEHEVTRQQFQKLIYDVKDQPGPRPTKPAEEKSAHEGLVPAPAPAPAAAEPPVSDPFSELDADIKDADFAEDGEGFHGEDEADTVLAMSMSTPTPEYVPDGFEPVVGAFGPDDVPDDLFDSVPPSETAADTEIPAGIPYEEELIATRLKANMFLAALNTPDNISMLLASIRDLRAQLDQLEGRLK